MSQLLDVMQNLTGPRIIEEPIEGFTEMEDIEWESSMTDYTENIKKYHSHTLLLRVEQGESSDSKYGIPLTHCELVELPVVACGYDVLSFADEFEKIWGATLAGSDCTWSFIKGKMIGGENVIVPTSMIAVPNNTTIIYLHYVNRIKGTYKQCQLEGQVVVSKLER